MTGAVISVPCGKYLYIRVLRRPLSGVAPRSHIPDMLARHALLNGRLSTLGVTRNLPHGTTPRLNFLTRFPTTAEAATARKPDRAIVEDEPAHGRSRRRRSGPRLSCRWERLSG